MKFVRTCIAAAALAPVLAFGAIGPGQYDVAGIQQICLTGSGTWYGTTFPSWGGGWQQLTIGTKVHTHIYGNYSAGAGNDSMQFKGSKGSWTEWRDDLSFQTVLNPVKITFVKAACDPPALRAQGGKANPQQ
ncbi:MAG TPA: hypothetical protein VGQ91_00830 [Ideonella sp.]|jgi:hypothetical protein|nr:hypothetical protein [Ideonella sp.]